MPRGARIDGQGLLHHVRGRGVAKRRIFLSDEDREDFLFRLNRVCEEHGAVVYAWCLMSNHFHLAIRTGNKPLAKTMTGVLTGKRKPEIQDVDGVLCHFGRRVGKARRELIAFMALAEAKKEEKIFKGGVRVEETWESLDWILADKLD